MADSRYTANQRKTGDIATHEGALDTSQIYILGIFGHSQKMKAMVREPYKGVRTVGVGDRLSVGPIVGIDPRGLLIQQGGETRRLKILQ